MIRALIIDDEEPARRRLRELLEEVDAITVRAECADGHEAVEAIESERPDLIFLDVQMPEMDGFEVLATVEPGLIPVVIFVTAYDHHAVEAFEARALDYLLKPFSRPRFDDALDRARERLAEPAGNHAEEVDRLLDERGPPSRIAVREDRRIRFVEVASIDWLEADGNYVLLHTGEEVHRIRATLKRTVERLEPAGFMRIHQSYAVNRARITELQPWSHGEFAVVLESGKSLVSSRSYNDRLRKMLEL